MTDRKELAISINQFVRSLVIDPKQKDSARSQYLAIADFIINRERQLRTELVAMTAERDKAVLSNKARDDYDLYCQECGRSHILDTSIPRDIWNKITERDSVGVLCAVCIDKRLTEMGLSCEAEFYYGGDSLNGRCYDSEPHNRKMQAERDKAVSDFAEQCDLVDSMHKELAAAKARTSNNVIVFCGSSKFTDMMAVCMWIVERDEHAIAMGLHLLPDWYCTFPDHLAEHEGVADEMDELHLRKIDMADEIFVVDVVGYIGDSTKREIAYAESKGKPIRRFTTDGNESIRALREQVEHE